MSFTSDLINSRRSGKDSIEGSQISGSQVDRPKGGSFTQNLINQRRASTSTSGSGFTLPPLTRVSDEPFEIEQPERSFFDKVGAFFGAGTGEIGSATEALKKPVPAPAQSKAGELPEFLKPKNLFNAGRDIFDRAKNAIVDTIQDREEKKKEFFDKSIDLKKLTFDQIRDFESDRFLKVVEPDLVEDLKKLNAKKTKNVIDNWRIKNISNTLNEVKKTQALSFEEKKSKDAFITGLALSRSIGSLTGGFLGVAESVADFIKWRGDVAGAEGVSEFSEKAGDRIAVWADEVRPSNPQMADKLLQGVGSTIPFYFTGLGVSSVTGRLASVSPAVAKLFGVGTSAVLEAGVEAGSVYQNNIDRGLSNEEADIRASRVFAGNVVFNFISDRVGLFNDATGIEKFLVAGMGEGTQESWQNTISNIALDLPAFEGLEETFMLSFLTGAGLGTFGNVLQDPEVRKQLNDEDLAKLDKFEKAVTQSNGDPAKFKKIIDKEFAEEQKEAPQVSPTGKEAVIAPTEEVVQGKKVPQVVEKLIKEAKSLDDLEANLIFPKTRAEKKAQKILTEQFGFSDKNTKPLADLYKQVIGEQPGPLLKEVEKFKTAEEFADKLLSGEVIPDKTDIDKQLDVLREKRDNLNKRIVDLTGEGKGLESKEAIDINKELKIVNAEMDKLLPRSRELIVGTVTEGAGIDAEGAKESRQKLIDFFNESKKEVKPLKKIIEKKKAEIKKKVGKPTELPDLDQDPQKKFDEKGKEKKPIEKKGKGGIFDRVFEQLRLETNVEDNFDSIVLREQAQKATDYMEKNPEDAILVSLRQKAPPPGVTFEAINIATSKQALSNKQAQLYTDLVSARSIIVARSAQSLGLERLVNSLSTDTFVQEVFRSRLLKLSSSAGFTAKFKRIIRGKGKISLGLDIISENATALKNSIDTKVKKEIKSAQDIIDKLTC